MIFDQAEEGEASIAVPTIVLAEALYLIEKKRVTLKLKEVLRKLEIGWNYTTIPLDLRLVARMEAVGRLLELHDRIIVASAALLGAPLITKDEAIRRAKYVQTLW